MKFEQKEIVLVPFPYSDLSALKRRPVLIISNDNFNISHDDVVVMAISSKLFIDDYSIEIDDNSLEFGILPEKSVIKTSKLFSISKKSIIKKFSKINDSTFIEAITKLNKLISKI